MNFQDTISKMDIVCFASVKDGYNGHFARVVIMYNNDNKCCYVVNSAGLYKEHIIGKKYDNVEDAKKEFNSKSSNNPTILNYYYLNIDMGI